ncbi:hypothetical protein ACFL4W_02320 [Planctomycetota bacterium]
MPKLNLEKKGPPVGMSHGEKRHLIIMFAALLVMGFFLLKPYIDPPPEKLPERRLSTEGAEQDNISHVAGEKANFAGEDEDKDKPKAHPENFKPGQMLIVAEDLALMNPEGTATDKLFDEVVSQAIGMFEEELKAAINTKGFTTIEEEERLLHIGQAFVVYGHIKDLKLATVKLTTNTARKLPFASAMYQGVVTDEKGARSLVRGVHVFEGYILNKPVTCNAIYSGMIETVTDKGVEILPLFVFKDLNRVSFDPLAGVTEFTAGMILGDKEIWKLADDRLFDVIEKDPYYHAIKILMGLSHKDLVKCIDPDLTYHMLNFHNQYPAQHRGKVFRVEGQLLRVEERMMNEERAVTKEVPNSPFLFVGQILDEVSRKPFTFRVLEIPNGLKVDDHVELVGIYTQIYTYQNQMGEKYYTRTPLLIGHKLIRYKRVFPIMGLVAGVAALFVVMMFWAAISERRRTRSFEKRMEEIKSRRLQRAKDSLKGEKGDAKPTGEPLKETEDDDESQEEESEESDDKKDESDTDESGDGDKGKDEEGEKD